MNIPDYTAPASLQAALDLKTLHGADARIIAGGTDLLLRMKENAVTPKLLIDLRRVSLDKISCTEDEMSLGARVTLSRVLDNASVASLFPALGEACRHFAAPPVRNRATVGGNLVNASPAGDLHTPLMAYDASVVLTTRTSNRVVPLTDFFLGPGQTVVEPDEILTEIKLPLMPQKTAAKFVKLGLRKSMAISVVNLTTRITLAETGVVNDARIALGAMAPTPVRALEAESLLDGNKISEDLISRAARQASRQTRPIGDLRASARYRENMAEVLVRRALRTTWDELIRGSRHV